MGWKEFKPRLQSLDLFLLRAEEVGMSLRHHKSFPGGDFGMGLDMGWIPPLNSHLRILSLSLLWGS